MRFLEHIRNGAICVFVGVIIAALVVCIYNLSIPWNEKRSIRALAREYTEASASVDLERMRDVATGMALTFYEQLPQKEAEKQRCWNSGRRLSLKVS